MSMVWVYCGLIVWLLFLVGVFLLFGGTPRDPLEFEDEAKLEKDMKQQAIREVMNKILNYSRQIKERYAQQPKAEPEAPYIPERKKKRTVLIRHDQTYSKWWN